MTGKVYILWLLVSLGHPPDEYRMSAGWWPDVPYSTLDMCLEAGAASESDYWTCLPESLKPRGQLASIRP